MSSTSESEDEDLSVPLRSAVEKTIRRQPSESSIEDEDLTLYQKPSHAARFADSSVLQKQGSKPVPNTDTTPVTDVNSCVRRSGPPNSEFESEISSGKTLRSDGTNDTRGQDRAGPEDLSKNLVVVSTTDPGFGVMKHNTQCVVNDLAREKPRFEGRPVNPREDILVGHEGDETVLPGCTAQWLRPYQIDGILFMYDLYTSKTGGILGDDMGLGKTVQVIGFLTAVFGKNGTYDDWKRMRNMRASGQKYPVVMIICPGTLIDNWIREFDVWSWTHIAKYHGNSRHDALQAIASGRSEVLITTYTTYKNNRDALNQVAWDVVIADECHIIKEKTSKVTKSVNEVKSRCRIGLTGTAIQNNYDELYTLLNWTNPGRYGTPAGWYHDISSVLKNGQKHNATNFELSAARIKATELSRNLLPRVLLRRTKALIAHQLPRKTDKVVFCPLTQLQITAYDNLMISEEMTFLRDAKQPCPCGSGLARLLCCFSESPTGQTFAQLLFPHLHYLRNLSNHMALCLPKQGDADFRRARDQALLEEALPHDWKRLASRTPMQNGCDAELCGKWKILQKLLMHWKREGSKVLIFSSSVKLLDMLNDLMMQEGYLYEYLHGGMTLEARTTAVANFNTNPSQFVFLISTRAGGVGLNIVSANKVVIFDPNWNPAHDLQAQDRAYRIGQQRDVEVYRLISVGTVEETVYARQVYKQQQANIGYEASEERRYFRGVQGDPDQRGELFGVENLLTFHGENHVLESIFRNTDQAEQEFDNIRMADIDIIATREDLENADSKDEFGIQSIVKAEFSTTWQKDHEEISDLSNEETISQILANAGVSYSHKQTEIIGRSKVEAEISRVAATAAMDETHRDRQAYLATILKTKKRKEACRENISQHEPKKSKPQSDEARTSKKVRSLPWLRKK